jgi:Spy/CpxP family protein refolding chaperone
VIAPGTAPETEVMKMVDQVETARADLNKTRTLMVYRMHLLLTPDQRIKMKALHDRWEQERRKGGRPTGR